MYRYEWIELLAKENHYVYNSLKRAETKNYMCHCYTYVGMHGCVKHSHLCCGSTRNKANFSDYMQEIYSIGHHFLQHVLKCLSFQDALQCRLPYTVAEMSGHIFARKEIFRKLYFFSPVFLFMHFVSQYTYSHAFLVNKLCQPVASFIHPYILLISGRNLFNEFLL